MATKTIFYQILPKNTPKTSKKGLKTPKIPLFWPFFHDFSWPLFSTKVAIKWPKRPKVATKCPKNYAKLPKLPRPYQCLATFIRAWPLLWPLFSTKVATDFRPKFTQNRDKNKRSCKKLQLFIKILLLLS